MQLLAFVSVVVTNVKNIMGTQRLHVGDGAG